MDVVGLYSNIPAPPYSILVMAELEEEKIKESEYTTVFMVAVH